MPYLKTRKRGGGRRNPTKRKYRRKAGGSDPNPPPVSNPATKEESVYKPLSHIVPINKPSKSDIKPLTRARDLFYVAVSSITYLSPQGFNYLLALITEAYKKAEKALMHPASDAENILLALLQELAEKSKVGEFTKWRKSNHAEIVFNPIKRMFSVLGASAKKRVVFNPRTFMQNVVDVGPDKKKIKEPIEVPVSPWNPTVAFFHDPKVDGNGYLVVEDSALAFGQWKKSGAGRNVKMTVSFRGSSSARNWIQNAKSLVKRVEAMRRANQGSTTAPRHWIEEGSFPLGFLNSLNPLMMPIMKVITATLSKTKELPVAVPVELAITGHSLGGAMASIMFLVLMTSESPEIAAIRKRVGIDNIHLYAISPAPVLPRGFFNTFVTKKAAEDHIRAAKLAEELGRDTTLIWTQGDPVPFIHPAALPGSGTALRNIPLPGLVDQSQGWRLLPIKSHTTLCLDDAAKHCITSFHDNAFKAKAVEAAAEKDTSSDYLTKCRGAHVVTVMQKAVPFGGKKPGVGMKKAPTQEETKMTNFTVKFFESDRKVIEKAATDISKELEKSAVAPLFSRLDAMKFYDFITGACEVPKRDNGCPPDVESINKCSAKMPAVAAAAGGSRRRTRRRRPYKR